jgi:hypothetical protein
VNVLDPEYDGEVVTLTIHVFDAPEADLPAWHPWMPGETARMVGCITRRGQNHVRPTSATQGTARGVEELIVRDGRYYLVPCGVDGWPSHDLGTDSAAAVAHLRERLATLTAVEPAGQMELGL